MISADAVGWKAKNVRLLSDAWAACGYTAVVPDLLITGPVPEDGACAAHGPACMGHHGLQLDIGTHLPALHFSMTH